MSKSSFTTIISRLSRIPYIILGRRSFLEKHLCADRSGLCGGPSATPGWASDRNTAKNIVYTMDYPKEKRASSETKRGPSGYWKSRTDPKVTGSIKCIFSVLVDRLGCTAGPSVTALSDIWRHIKCTIVIVIAITTNLCDFSRWCAGADRPDQGRGPSAVDRKGATTRKWLEDINTTPTTSIHMDPSLSFNTRAFTSTKDTFQLPNLSKFHNCD
jgi:hypothetical protein